MRVRGAVGRKSCTTLISVWRLTAYERNRDLLNELFCRQFALFRRDLDGPVRFSQHTEAKRGETFGNGLTEKNDDRSKSITQQIIALLEALHEPRMSSHGGHVNSGPLNIVLWSTINFLPSKVHRQRPSSRELVAFVRKRPPPGESHLCLAWREFNGPRISSHTSSACKKYGGKTDASKPLSAAPGRG